MPNYNILDVYNKMKDMGTSKNRKRCINCKHCKHKIHDTTYITNNDRYNLIYICDLHHFKFICDVYTENNCKEYQSKEEK